MKSGSKFVRLGRCIGVLILTVVVVGLDNAVAGSNDPIELVGDINGDGCVDDVDLEEIQLWNGVVTTVNHPVTGRLDLDGNGIVDFSDFDTGAANFGTCR
jgi:hypothetical protein